MYNKKGDLKYGSKRSNKDGSINLFAYSMEFIHPIKKNQLKIKAPIPKGKIWESCI